MNAQEALKVWKTNRLILLTGDDMSARRQCLTALTRVAEEAGDMDVSSIVADSRPVEEWLGEVYTIPFLSEYRTVIVRQLSRVEAPKGVTLDGIPESGRLIMVIDDESGDPDKVDKMKRWGEQWIKVAIAAKGLVIRSQTPKKDQDVAVVGRAEELGFKITRSAARTLLAMVGNNINQAYTELPILALYAEKGKAITETDIEAVVTPDPEYDIYKLVDAVMARKPRESVNQFRSMVRRYRRADTEVYSRIFPSFGRQLSFVWQARCAMDLRSQVQSPSPELAACMPQTPNLGTQSDWIVQRAHGTARTTSIPRLRVCFLALAKAESQLKGLEPYTSLTDTIETMILEMCHA